MTHEVIGVAISTTGDDHRLPLLRQSVALWLAVLEPEEPLFVTVDGDEAALAAVSRNLQPLRGLGDFAILRVGQPTQEGTHDVREGRLGVACNKNTGLEALMNYTRSGAALRPAVDHLFLSDDDAGPLSREALLMHVSMATRLGVQHSMVCWGKHRVDGHRQDTSLRARWTWPRGSVLYVEREVVSRVGGMREEFGPGGHEHVEWSQRIYRAGFTPEPYVSPSAYVSRRAMGARDYWWVNDMPQEGESLAITAARKKSATSVRRQPGDWVRIEAVMAESAVRPLFSPYRAGANGRESATMAPDNTSQGEAP